MAHAVATFCYAVIGDEGAGTGYSDDDEEDEVIYPFTVRAHKKEAEVAMAHLRDHRRRQHERQCPTRVARVVVVEIPE